MFCSKWFSFQTEFPRKAWKSSWSRRQIVCWVRLGSPSISHPEKPGRLAFRLSLGCSSHGAKTIDLTGLLLLASLVSFLFWTLHGAHWVQHPPDSSSLSPCTSLPLCFYVFPPELTFIFPPHVPKALIQIYLHLNPPQTGKYMKVISIILIMLSYKCC